MNKNKIKVIILAAGEGTRLRPYTLDKPKCMVEIDGKSLIDRQISVLEKAGIDEIVLVGGYKIEMLKGKGSRIKENSNYSKTNMVWTLFCAEDELQDDVIISYGDIVYSKKILEKLIDSKKDIAVIIDKNWEYYWKSRSDNPLDDLETLKLDHDKRITEIGKQPSSLQEIQGQYIGLIKLSKKGIEQMKDIFYQAKKSNNLLGKSPKNAYLTDLLQLLIESGVEVSSIPVDSEWVEIDTIEDMNAEITSTRLKNILNED